jgi:hypothetical protein
LKKTIISLFFTLSLFGDNGWYFSDNCESIKNYQLQTPLQLMSEYGCKPIMDRHTEGSADMGMLAFDCSKTDLKGYINVIYTKERCVLLQQYMKNKGK